MDKKSLSERDICTKFITPAVEKSGWNRLTQLLEEVSFTDGKIYVRGKLTARGNQKRADYILYYKPNIPIAIIEAMKMEATITASMAGTVKRLAISSTQSVDAGDLILVIEG
jgi:type I restriction enzyme R subunit